MVARSTVTTSTFAAVIGVVAFFSESADGHQRITIPAPTFTNADRNVNWNPLAFLENQGVKTSADILGYLKTMNVKNLREFMDNKANYKIEAAGASFECGYTDPNGARQPVPANGMMRSTGYTHEGPCEIWIDDVMVKHGDNCHFDIGSKAVSYKIDFSACKGDCMLRWYWFGNRLIGKKRSWQVYKACVPMKGSDRARSIDEREEADDTDDAELRSFNETEAFVPTDDETERDTPHSFLGFATISQPEDESNVVDMTQNDNEHDDVDHDFERDNEEPTDA